MEKAVYYNQVDTLRAFAAVGVINLHWLNGGTLKLYGLEESINWGFGKFGVQLFFVLSGFLITGILLKDKVRADKRRTIINFFVKRALRLFPIYYLLLIFLVVIKDEFVIDNIGWFLTYTANIKFFIEGGLVDVWSNHLWTLSIEEQFYLVFPAIILFLPTKKEYHLAIGFIVLGFTARLVLSEAIGNTAFLLIVSQLEMLGAGILLALIKKDNSKLYKAMISKKAKILTFLMLGGCIITYYYLLHHTLAEAVFSLLLMVAFSLLTINTVDGFKGFAGKIFELRFLRYLGKISYGLYLYHKVIPYSLIIVLNKLDLQIGNVVIYYVLNLSILLVVTHFSWVLIEARILKFKKRFEYKHEPVMKVSESV